MAAPARPMTDAERWYRERYCKTPERDALFTTISGEPVEPLYTAEDLPDEREIGYPGEFPFTRGVYPSMYRGRSARSVARASQSTRSTTWRRSSRASTWAPFRRR